MIRRHTQRQMRFSIVLRLLGWLLLLEGIMLLIPTVFAIAEGAGDEKAFMIPLVMTSGCGAALALGLRRSPTRINRREAFLLTTLVWILFSLFGMIPFMLCAGPQLSVSDAFFETMSGFTTTGATTITDVEAHTHALLLWRSMIQWVGGLGIILFILAVMPELNQTGGLSMFNAEITGITHDKLHPRIRSTAMSLWKVYSLLTLAMILLLWAGQMDFFDSVCQSLTTLATGGFSTRNASIAGFDSRYVASVVTLFMLLGGTNFSLIYMSFHGQPQALWRNDVFRAYIGIVAGAWILVVAWQVSAGADMGVTESVINPLFMIASAISSTGFSYEGFAGWGNFGLMIIIMLMLCGACAGSTTSGIKVDRVMSLTRHLRNEINVTVFPRHVQRVEVGGRILTRPVLSRIVAFITIYMLLIMLGVLVLSCYGVDLLDGMFAVTSCIGNNGLGYGLTAGSFGTLPDACKWLLSFLMLAGRLELFTVLVLFSRAFWHR